MRIPAKNDGAAEGAGRGAEPIGRPLGRLAVRVLLVGLACFLSTEAIAHNFPPLYVSPIWPTNAILLCVLTVTPVRHWWAYAIAGFFSSVNNNARDGATLFQILTFLSADAIEVFTAALAVRRFARGLGVFDGGRNLLAFLAVVFTAPIVPASLATLTAPVGERWILWSSWFLTDAFGYLTLAPAILAWAGRWRAGFWGDSRTRNVESGLLVGGLVLASAWGFTGLLGNEGNSVALLYLPLPFLLWAAIRFGPRGATVCLAMVTILAMWGVLHGHGPFTSGSPSDNALSLQLFLITIAPPLMFLAALVEEQQRSQQELRSSEARYRAIVEDQTEMICRFRPDGAYTFVNGAMCRALRRTAPDLLGRSLWDFLPVEAREIVRDAMNSITLARPVASREMGVDSPGRGARWQHWTTRGFFDERGTITEYQAVGRDITARKRAEEEHRQLESQRQIERVLRESEARFRSLCDNAPVLIWMSGLRNEALYFNKPWLDFTGRSIEQELGFGWIESVHPDDRESVADACNAAFVRREPAALHFRLRRHDGVYRWVLDNGIPHFGADGAFSGYIGSCVDITSRKLAEEELEQAARRKDEFLAMLGHELRNPLAPIGMAVEIIRKLPPDTARTASALDVIARQLSLLTRLVDDLLDVSRITRGKITLLTAPVELSAVVAQAVETSRPLIEGRGHELHVVVPEEPVRVQGDAARLSQVLSNLLNNAARYTPNGGRIGLTVDRQGDHAIVVVSDNGIGLTADMIERVFDLFAQLESRDRAQGGLGVGLTLVKRLVEQHGGEVEARSAGRGQGSQFIVRLPALEDQSECDSDAPSVPVQTWIRRRILVVDDNVDAAETLSQILKLQKHEVSVAHDGYAALDMAAAMRPDVVFLDLELPQISGIEVARRLRSATSGRPLILIATTGYGQDEDRRRTTEAGFDHHLVKPIDPEVLARVLMNVKAIASSK
ncbi:MAG TPA: PAS domain S-box protein [Terriglobia bacterium]|nr:PAS domain S-box protein [Terriglobia bacterium]